LLATLTFALAYASINLDNLALVLGLSPIAGVARVAVAFAVTQAVVIGVAAALGDVAEFLPTAWLGWLGAVPLALGLWQAGHMFRTRGAAGREPVKRDTGVPVMMLTFGGLSIDSFVLTVALIADCAETFDAKVIFGALIAICAVAAIGIAAARAAARIEAVVIRLERLAPFVMIASGLYILSDTVTDVI